MEDLVVQVLGKVHLLFGLMDEQGASPRYRHHIYLLPTSLWETQKQWLLLLMVVNYFFFLYLADTVYRMLAFISCLPCLLRGRLRTHTQILRGSICRNTTCVWVIPGHQYLYACRVHGSSGQTHILIRRYGGYFQGLSEVLDHVVELLVWSRSFSKLKGKGDKRNPKQSYRFIVWQRFNKVKLFKEKTKQKQTNT